MGLLGLVDTFQQSNGQFALFIRFNLVPLRIHYQTNSGLWLRSVEATSIYEKDEYWIKRGHDRMRPIQHGAFAENADTSLLGLDAEGIANLDLTGEDL